MFAHLAPAGGAVWGSCGASLEEVGYWGRALRFYESTSCPSSASAPQLGTDGSGGLTCAPASISSPLGGAASLLKSRRKISDFSFKLLFVLFFDHTEKSN